MKRIAVSTFSLFLLLGLAQWSAFAQNPAGQPMGAQPTPDTSRIQQEMQSNPQMPSGGKGSAPEAKMGTHVLPPAGPLKVSFGDKSSEWTAEKLAALPHTTITVYNGQLKKNQTFSGVPLIDLLTRVGVPDKPHGRDFELYFVAEGSDGYKVVYSVSEATPEVHDGTVIVADKLQGQPIAGTGPLQLVATGEKQPARWVRNLVAVRVMTAQ